MDFHWKTSTDQLILILSNCLRLHQQSNLCASPESQLNVPGTSIRQSSYGASGRVCTKSLGLWLILLVPGVLHAQHALETSAQQKFISGGTIRLHLEAGGYTITPVDSENIVVTCRAHTEEQLKRVKVEIKLTAAGAATFTFPKPRTTTSRPPSRFLVIPIFGPDCRRENWWSKMWKAIRISKFSLDAFRLTFPTLSSTVTAMLRSRPVASSPLRSMSPKGVCSGHSSSTVRGSTVCMRT